MPPRPTSPPPPLCLRRRQKRESRNAALVAEVELTGRELAQSRDQNQQLQRDLKEAESLNATLRQEQENNAGECTNFSKSSCCQAWLDTASANIFFEQTALNGELSSTRE